MKIDSTKIPLLNNNNNLTDQQKSEIGNKALGTLFGFGDPKVLTEGKGKNSMTLKTVHVGSMHPYSLKSIFEVCYKLIQI